MHISNEQSSRWQLLDDTNIQMKKIKCKHLEGKWRKIGKHSEQQQKTAKTRTNL